MFARLYLSVLLAFAIPARAQLPVVVLPELEVTVERIDQGGEQVFEVTASGAVRSSQAKVWRVLTDYERMPEFVPDLKQNKILSRNGPRIVLEQKGVVRFLFFRRKIHLVVQVTEEPMSIIDIELVAGDMKIYHCRWELQPLASGGTRITYRGTLVPKFYVPGMFGANMIGSDIADMMEAVFKRIDKPPQAG